MRAAQVIEAIKELSIPERLEVLRFLREYEAARKLSPEELGILSKRLATSPDPNEIAALKKAIVSGFYCAKTDA